MPDEVASKISGEVEHGNHCPHPRGRHNSFSDVSRNRRRLCRHRQTLRFHFPGSTQVTNTFSLPKIKSKAINGFNVNTVTPQIHRQVRQGNIFTNSSKAPFSNLAGHTFVRTYYDYCIDMSLFKLTNRASDCQHGFPR